MQTNNDMPAEFWLTELAFAAHMVKGQIERGARPEQGDYAAIRSNLLRTVADMLDEQRADKRAAA